jgi:hypothetical protein
MLKPYLYKHSPIHNAQRFVNYIVLEFFCKAPKLSHYTFSSTLVLPKYQNLLNGTAPKHILNPISGIYKICRQLNKEQTKVLKRAIINNNRVRELCNMEIQPVLYADIAMIDKSLSKLIREFCDNLYNHCLSKQPFYSTFGHLADYYDNLVGKSEVCRFCGIKQILTKHHKHRSAFDHYLPKSQYPFSSINFKNLIPICDTCNSKYKLTKNTLFEKSKNGKVVKLKPIKAFYPFRKTTPDIKVLLKLKTNYSANLKPTDIVLDFACVGFEEQVKNWDRIFGIKENYLAKACTEEMFSHYEEHYLADKNWGLTHENHIEKLTNNKMADGNFLKIALLEAIANFRC